LQEFYNIYEKANITDSRRDSIEFEKLHNQVCKKFIGVGNLSTNLAARVELGRLPLFISIMRNTLNYWLKLEKANEGSLLYQCFESEKELTNLKIKSWYSTVDLMRRKHSPQYQAPPCKGTIAHIMDNLINAAKNRCIESMTESKASGQGNKLRTYAKIKHSVEIDRYLLSKCLTWRQKRNLAKFRLGDHKLRIETGRHNRPRLLPEQRICRACSMNKVEDEIHFLIECPIYANLRNKHLIINAQQDSVANFTSLLTSKDHNVWINLNQYLEAALSIREDLNAVS